jgi:hypothetical protein
MKTTKQDRARLRAENRKWPKELKQVPKECWIPVDWENNSKRTCVWRSRDWLIQIFDEGYCIRMSVNRTDQGKDGNWVDGIAWDELQDLKRKVGYGEFVAVEIYPQDKDIVNVANMRHLWILKYAAEKTIEAVIPWWKKPS